MGEDRVLKYYSDFGKCLLIEYNNCNDMQIEKIDFWIKKFTPSVEEIKCNSVDYYICIQNSLELNKVIEKSHESCLIGNISENEASIGKYISQLFQKLVINDGIIFVHGAGVAMDNKGVIIIGDYGQGKTSVALGCIMNNKNIILLSDNCVAVKEKEIIGSTSSISLRKVNEKMLSKLHIDNSFFHSNRVYYDYSAPNNGTINISSIVIPHINAEDNNNYKVPDDIARIYLFEKFTSLLKGETLLFNGRFPTKSNANKNNLKIILNEINFIVDQIGLKYLSCNYDKLVEIITNEIGENSYAKRL